MITSTNHDWFVCEFFSFQRSRDAIEKNIYEMPVIVHFLLCLYHSSSPQPISPQDDLRAKNAWRTEIESVQEHTYPVLVFYIVSSATGWPVNRRLVFGVTEPPRFFQGALFSLFGILVCVVGGFVNCFINRYAHGFVVARFIDRFICGFDYRFFSRLVGDVLGEVHDAFAVAVAQA